MNINGMLIYTRIFTAASTAAQPVAFGVFVGKGLKNFNLFGYKSSGKSIGAELITNNISFNNVSSGLQYQNYDETTGIVYFDAGVSPHSSFTTAVFRYNDLTSSNTAYITLSASKAPSLVGIPQVQPRIATLSDVKSSGTAGGASAAATTQTRTLNTIVDSTGIVTSLIANQFVLPAGTYYIEASAPAQRSDKSKIRLRNITTSSTSILGTSENVDGTLAAQTRSVLSGEVIIATSTTFELQHYTQTALASIGLGVASSTGENEVYSIVKITKVK
jgi:hypothetical protein